MFIICTVGTLVLYMGLLQSEFSCYFSFSIFNDHRSLKIEYENNRMKTKIQKFDHKSLIYIWYHQGGKALNE